MPVNLNARAALWAECVRSIYEACEGLVSFRHSMVRLSAGGTEFGQVLHEGMGIERECYAPDVVTPKTAATSAVSPLSSAAAGV